MSLKHVLALGVLSVLTMACDDATGVPPFRPFEVVIESGDGQVAAAGDTLPESVVARLVQPDGTTRLRDVQVQLVDGGFADLGPTRGAGVGTVLGSSTPGMATVTWVLPDEVGTHRLRFFALQLNGDTVEGFATAEAEEPGT